MAAGGKWQAGEWQAANGHGHGMSADADSRAARTVRLLVSSW